MGGAVKWLAGWSIRQLYCGGYQCTDVVIVDLGWLLEFLVLSRTLIPPHCYEHMIDGHK